MNGTNLIAYFTLGAICLYGVHKLGKWIHRNERSKKRKRFDWFLLLADPLGLLAAILLWPLVIAGCVLFLALEAFHLSGKAERNQEKEEKPSTMEMIDLLKAEHQNLNPKIEPDDLRKN